MLQLLIASKCKSDVTAQDLQRNLVQVTQTEVENLREKYREETLDKF